MANISLQQLTSFLQSFKNISGEMILDIDGHRQSFPIRTIKDLEPKEISGEFSTLFPVTEIGLEHFRMKEAKFFVELLYFDIKAIAKKDSGSVEYNVIGEVDINSFFNAFH